MKRKIGDFIRKFNTLDTEIIKVPFFEDETSIRIVQLSDLHIPRNAFMVTEIAKVVKDLKPDLIFITGDMMDGKWSFNGAKLSLITKLLVKIGPVYVVSGNHERRHKKYYQIWETMMKLLGTKYLKNEISYITFSGKRIGLIGLKDMTTKDALDEDFSFLTKMERNLDLVLMLTHRPNEWRKFYPEKGPLPDFVFSGHAHGGQVGIPLLNRGLIGPNKKILPKFVNGLYKYEDGSCEIISRGLACATRPVRINNRPHIPVLDITKK